MSVWLCRQESCFVKFAMKILVWGKTPVGTIHTPGWVQFLCMYMYVHVAVPFFLSKTRFVLGYPMLNAVYHPQNYASIIIQGLEQTGQHTQV